MYRNRNLVRVAILDANRDIRAVVRGSMRDIGFSSIFETDRPRDVIRAILLNEVDLLICDLTLQDEVMCSAVRDIRFRRLGENPFPITVGMTGNPDQKHISRALNAGYDLVLLKPIHQARLKHRIEAFVAERKPFVVTADYVGPDRRESLRDDNKSAPLLSVPNPVRLLSEGNSRMAVTAQIKSASSELDDQKVQRAIAAICWIVSRYRDTLDDIEAVGIRRTYLRDLKEQLEDAILRIGTTGYADFQSRCLQIRDLALRVTENVAVPDTIDVDRLYFAVVELRREMEHIAAKPDRPRDPFAKQEAPC